MKDINYYNAESDIYSDKRYPVETKDYIHYFFKKRLSIVLDIIEKNCIQRDSQRLLEIGCADGIIIREIEERFSDKFVDMQGIDLSSQMIEAAKRRGVKNSKIKYAVRDDIDSFENNFNVIVEVGVINYTDFLAELKFIQKNLRKDGYCILSVAGRDALMAKFGKIKTGDFNNLLDYADYEKKIAEYFDFIKIVPCSFWLPGLWKFPTLAKLLQPCVDVFLMYLLPNFFHEKVYLLKTKK